MLISKGSHPLCGGSWRLSHTVALLSSLLVILCAGAVRAQVDGAYPYAGLTLGKDANYYGVTYNGGKHNDGMVFKITPAGTLTLLYSFGGSDGAFPSASLTPAKDGSFYAMTAGGGEYGNGTVFKITTAGKLTTLYSFSDLSGGPNGTNPDGAYPSGALIQGVDGSFYGSTGSGGTYGFGTVFKITTAGTLITLHSFNGGAEGTGSTGLTQGTDGNFYGVTPFGGRNTGGTVFKITPTGALTTLYNFRGGSGGSFPNAALTLGTDGNFYGTTEYGGQYGDGTVFMITPAGKLTSLHNFNPASDGSWPVAALTLGTDGSFYGTTQSGGQHGVGIVFKITAAGTFTTLYSLTGSGGAHPQAPVVEGSNHTFYGTAVVGGEGWGVVFKITSSGVGAVIHSFSANPAGYSPYSRLTRGKDGNFYGTTLLGGTRGDGTVFKVTPEGVLTSLYSFSGSDGASPYAALTLGKDGNFYGTTFSGGLYGGGTVFKITPSGTLTTLHSFDFQLGQWPVADLTLGKDGNFYGTTYSGGNNLGTVFKITPSGTLNFLHSFNGADGTQPSAHLVQGPDGSFYGTTQYGGTPSGTQTNGTIFKITPGGTLTTLYNFTGGNDGSVPMGALTLGSDGNFYGTTDRGGANNNGTIFKITPGGTLTTLYTFAANNGYGNINADGSLPAAALTQGKDGNFYGTTFSGGAYGTGTMFKITMGGTLTTLYDFMDALPTDGASYAWPANDLIQGKDGNYYGTTVGGGLYFWGTIFKITPTGTLTVLHNF